MPRVEDVSVVGRLYSNQTLRFGVFPELRTDFENTFYLEPIAYNLLSTRWSEQGTLICQHGSTRFLYDPATGIFKLSKKNNDILNGSLQTGQFGRALFFLELQGSERIYGLGAASASVNRNDQKFQLLTQAPTPHASSAFHNFSAFPFFRMREKHSLTSKPG